MTLGVRLARRWGMTAVVVIVPAAHFPQDSSAMREWLAKISAPGESSHLVESTASYHQY